MTTTVRVLAAAALMAVAITPAQAAEYWVRNGGNDAADGLSIATAWATLGHAADVVAPGDTVRVRDGSYAGFHLDRSGTPGAPITFVADGPNVAITADNGTTPDGINLEGASHVVIDGFVVNGRTRAGIRTVLGSHVTIRNCRAGHNGRWGILTGFVDDLLIENNVTHDSQIEHGIYVSNSGDRPVIRGNHSYDNRANGIHMNGDASLGGDGTISQAVVERNVIHGNGAGGGSGINMDGVTDSVVRNNLLHDNHASGISLYRIDGGSGSRDNLIANNTIVNAADGRWCVNVNNGSTGNRIVNNVLYNFHSFRGAIVVDASSRPGLESDHNAVISRFSADGGNSVMSLAAWQALGYDLHSFVTTPAQLFVAPGSDFHLLPDAPAVDAGTGVDAPSVDLDGNPRPVGGGVDVGAYELQLVACGDGTSDPGEDCGEPGLGCTDPCDTCSGCTCVAAAAVCGDGLVCGAEVCEEDADCAGGERCTDCTCANPAPCTSGITIAKAALTLRASPFAMTTKGEAVIPTPWQAVDPLARGVRVVIDAAHGAGGLDVAVPGGAAVDGTGWKVNRAGTTWTYRDQAGRHGGVTKVVVKDRSSKVPGLLAWTVKAKGGSMLLPDADAVRTTLVLGSAAECAALTWNAATGPRPRCQGDPARITCR